MLKNITKINRLIGIILTKYRYGFASVGKRSIVFFPMQIDNPKSIAIGNNTFVSHNAWLMGGDGEKMTLHIGDDCVIGNNCHIVAHHSVEIQNKVLFADKVFVSDCTHSYENTLIPIIDQEIVDLSSIVIGEGSWIGENVCILGASIGKHCVVGANSVVTKNVPDYSVVAGTPARVIQTYDFRNSSWVSKV